MQLTQNYAIIALNAQDSKRLTLAKKMALYCMGAGAVFELYLNNQFIKKGDKLVLRKESLASGQITRFQETILESLFKKNDELEGDFKWWISRASDMGGSKLKKVEKSIVDSLVGIDLIEEIPALLGCDLEYNTAGTSMGEYRSNASEYIKQKEGFRSEMLEEYDISDECIMMYWMIRESGCLLDVFSKREMNEVGNKINNLYTCNQLAKLLLPIEIKHNTNKAMHLFIKKKKEILSTQIGTGVAFAFPILDRAQTVFIETEEYGAKPMDRLTDITNRLVEKGHKIEVLRISSVPIIKIDNVLYEALPTQKIYKFPVFGVQLRKYQM